MVENDSSLLRRNCAHLKTNKSRELVNMDDAGENSTSTPNTDGNIPLETTDEVNALSEQPTPPHRARRHNKGALPALSISFVFNHLN